MSQDLVAQALSALRHKDYAQAIEAISLFATQHKLDVNHYLIKGLSQIALSNWQDAHDTFLEAVQHKPHNDQLWFNLGLTQENLGHIDAAQQCFEQCLSLNTQNVEIYGNLSNIYRKQGRYIDAEKMAHNACKYSAEKAQALNCLGLALSKQGKYTEAEDSFAKALSYDPTNADFLGNRANLAVDQLHFDDAWAHFASARAAHDSALLRRDEGMARLLAGDYLKGWPLYEARLELSSSLRHLPLCPRYRGESLTGKRLLLLAEQGLGDTLMFCRFGNYFSQQGAELIWVVQNSLKTLLDQQLLGRVYAESDHYPVPDYYLPLLSLPLFSHRQTPEKFGQAPYLKAPSKTFRLPCNGTRKRIGICWLGSTTHERNHERSLAIKQILSLWKEKRFDYYSLTKGADISECNTSLINLDNEMHDFSDTATIINQMDVVITVDTSVAHLAGALGIKTYILLPYCPDWRWGIEGETTPWYSSVTLLRQPSYADWDSVICLLQEKLEKV